MFLISAIIDFSGKSSPTDQVSPEGLFRGGREASCSRRDKDGGLDRTRAQADRAELLQLRRLCRVDSQLGRPTVRGVRPDVSHLVVKMVRT